MSRNSGTELLIFNFFNLLRILFSKEKDETGIQKIAKINSGSVKKRFNRIKGYEDSASVNKS